MDDLSSLTFQVYILVLALVVRSGFGRISWIFDVLYGLCTLRRVIEGRGN